MSCLFFLFSLNETVEELSFESIIGQENLYEEKAQLRGFLPEIAKVEFPALIEDFNQIPSA